MKRPAELLRVALAAALLLASVPGPAAAYIGPGGGLTLLTTALAMLAAFGVSTVVVLTWPYRAAKRWLQRRREKRKGGPEERKAEEP
jgi:hypothetical protein